MSSLVIFTFLGKNKSSIIIDIDSLSILNNMYMVIVTIGPYLVILGRNKEMIINLNICVVKRGKLVCFPIFLYFFNIRFIGH